MLGANLLAIVREFPIMGAMQALSVGLGLIGTIHINHRKIKGYYFWLGSNLLAVPVLAYAHLWWMTLLFTAYFVLSVDGLLKWKRDHASGETSTSAPRR